MAIWEHAISQNVLGNWSHARHGCHALDGGVDRWFSRMPIAAPAHVGLGTTSIVEGGLVDFLIDSQRERPHHLAGALSQ